jgi:uncharacterized protein YkwD
MPPRMSSFVPGARGLRQPALLAASVALLGWVIVLAHRPAGAAGDCTVSAADAAIDAEEQALLDGINAYRQQRGLPALVFSAALNKAAAWMSRDMAVNRYFDHTDRSGRSPFQRMADCGYGGLGTKGENLAAGPPDAATTLTMWKGSQGHNQNLLEPSFRAAGIARYFDASAPYRYYWTLDLGSVVDGGAAPGPAAPAPTVAPTPAPGVPTPPGTGGAQTGTGTVAITVALVGPDGAEAQGDRSGYVFTVAGNGRQFITPPTNAQGQTTLSLPAGSYTLTAPPRPGVTPVGFSGPITGAGNFAVGPGQTVTITVTNRVAAAASPTPTPAPTPAPAPPPPAPAPRPAAAPAMVELGPTCTNVALTWAAGTALTVVAAAISPAGALAGIWRYDAARGVYLGYAPIAGAPNDYMAVGAPPEAVFICMRTAGTLLRPA